MDGARFERLDRDFRYIIEAIVNDNRVTALCRINNLHHTLTTLLDQLNRCQKSLNEYLEVCYCSYVIYLTVTYPQSCSFDCSSLCTPFYRRNALVFHGFTLLGMKIYWKF